jgi:hypothetical protein
MWGVHLDTSVLTTEGTASDRPATKQRPHVYLQPTLDITCKQQTPDTSTQTRATSIHLQSPEFFYMKSKSVLSFLHIRGFTSGCFPRCSSPKLYKMHSLSTRSPHNPSPYWPLHFTTLITWNDLHTSQQCCPLASRFYGRNVSLSNLIMVWWSCSSELWHRVDSSLNDVTTQENNVILPTSDPGFIQTHVEVCLHKYERDCTALCRTISKTRDHLPWWLPASSDCCEKDNWCWWYRRRNDGADQCSYWSI